MDDIGLRFGARNDDVRLKVDLLVGIDVDGDFAVTLNAFDLMAAFVVGVDVIGVEVVIGSMVGENRSSN